MRPSLCPCSSITLIRTFPSVSTNHICLDRPVGRRQLDMLFQALLHSRDVAQRRQRMVISLLDIPPDEQRVVGDQPIDTRFHQVLDHVEPVGRPGLDLQARPVSGIHHRLVRKRDVARERGVVDGRCVGCGDRGQEIGSDGHGRLN